MEADNSELKVNTSSQKQKRKQQGIRIGLLSPVLFKYIQLINFQNHLAVFVWYSSVHPGKC